MTETEGLLILNAVPGIGNVRIRKLVERFGSAKKVFELSCGELIRSQILSAELVRKIFDFPQDSFLKSEYNLVQQCGVHVVAFNQDSYPQGLREFAEAPVVLYVRGQLPALEQPAVALVGSRRASMYGLSVARKFSSRLAQWGIVVVSGLARGVDTASHEGCLQAQGNTVAVLGCGLSGIYPPENKKLADRICVNGAVISEFPMSMPPLACNFPRRNRIISGMSLGVVVVEASEKSGALITSAFALEQGKDVFAVPGPVDSPNSNGVHRLIQDGARLTTRPEDILEELGPKLRAFLPERKDEKPSAGTDRDLSALAQDEKIVLGQLTEVPNYIDELIARCGLARNRVAAAILNLEFKHLARELPGKYFVRIDQGSSPV